MLRLLPKSTSDRIERDMGVAEAGLVRPVSPSTFVVASERGNVHYVVRADSGCTCPDALERRMICKHQWACWPGAMFTLWRIGMATSIREVAQIAACFRAEVPAGMRRTIEAEAERQRAALLV